VDRIAILGCGGSGKSHLARQLAGRLSLPLTHLDAIYYDDAWDRLSDDEFADIQRRLAAEPAWIIEGNYASTLPLRLQAVDTVIVLDLPAYVCLWGIAQRRWRHGPANVRSSASTTGSPGASSATSAATDAPCSPASTR
jgi:adenylate kinase family enzyme